MHRVDPGRIKELIVEGLRLEGITPAEIGDDMPLFNGGLGLDSVDALELVLALEQEYGFKVSSAQMTKETLSTVRAIAEFTSRMLSTRQPAAPRSHEP